MFRNTRFAILALACLMCGAKYGYSEDRALPNPALPVKPLDPTKNATEAVKVRQTVQSPIVALELKYAGKEKRATTTGVFIRQDQYLIAVLPVDENGCEVSKVFVKGLSEPASNGTTPLTARPLCRDAETGLALLETDLHCAYRYIWNTETALPLQTAAELLELDTKLNPFEVKRKAGMQLGVIDVTTEFNKQKLTNAQQWGVAESGNSPLPTIVPGPLMIEQGEFVAFVIGVPETHVAYAISAKRVVEITNRLCSGLMLPGIPQPTTEQQMAQIRGQKLPPGMGLFDYTLQNGDHYVIVVPFIDAEGHFLIPVAFTQQILPPFQSTVVYRHGQTFEVGYAFLDEQTGLAMWGITSSFPENSEFITFPSSNSALNVGETCRLSEAIPGLRQAASSKLISKELERNKSTSQANLKLRFDTIMLPGSVLYQSGVVQALVLGQDTSSRGGSVAFPADVVASAIARMKPAPASNVPDVPLPPIPAGKQVVTLTRAQLSHVSERLAQQGQNLIFSLFAKHGDNLTILVTLEEAKLISAILAISTPLVAASDTKLANEEQGLVRKYRTATPAEQPGIRNELEQVTAKHFELKHRQRIDELKVLEIRMEKLRASLAQREQLKDQIVQKRVADLLNIENPLQWDTEADTSNAAASRVKLMTPAQVNNYRVPTVPTYDDPDSSAKNQFEPESDPSARTVGNIMGPVRGRGQVAIKSRPVQKPVKFAGRILSVDLQGYTEISLGVDDGLTLGQTLNVFRPSRRPSDAPDESNNLKDCIGCLEVIAVQSDRSACKPIPGSRVDFMQEGDEITTDPIEMEKAAITNAELAALQGNWIQDELKEIDPKLGPPPTLDRWTIDGRLFMVHNNGQVRCRGVVNLGQTKTTKFIQIRQFEQYGHISDGRPGPAPAMASPNAPTDRSICFLYRFQGDILETQGFGATGYSSSSHLPQEFGGKDDHGDKPTIMALRRIKNSDVQVIPGQ
ncbi:MAG: hypothetical protein JWM11_3506 [Planctomycetaceae bacterium]|nr:hypothetical protein [Planctomycetaceae bacterium]